MQHIQIQLNQDYECFNLHESLHATLPQALLSSSVFRSMSGLGVGIARAPFLATFLGTGSAKGFRSKHLDGHHLRRGTPRSHSRHSPPNPSLEQLQVTPMAPKNQDDVLHAQPTCVVQRGCNCPFRNMWMLSGWTNYPRAANFA